MRIVAGEFRGRTIRAPEGDATRPTIDRVREALMSSLYSLTGGFEGMAVLDAFAGSGALGLEALSRGAKRADFYEIDAKTARIIEGNIRACGLDESRATVFKRDVFHAFVGASERPEARRAYGLIFLDPPYRCKAADVFKLLSMLDDAGRIDDQTVIAYEHASKDSEEVQACASGFEVIAMRKYGKTAVALLRKS